VRPAILTRLSAIQRIAFGGGPDRFATASSASNKLANRATLNRIKPLSLAQRHSAL
jgi:hypothetical protein